MQQFFTDTIQSRFVKDLIYTTPIPVYNTTSRGNRIYKGETYIYNSKIIKCTKSGLLDTSGNRATYDVISNYTFGKHYPKFTERYASNYSYYDSATHQWLGRLLRCYRDIWNLDLMPFYNCFSEDYISGLRILPTDIENSPNTVFRTLKIPIKFNTTYTIAIDCSSEVLIAPAVISNNNLVEVKLGDSTYNLTQMVLGETIYETSGEVPQAVGKQNIKKFTDLSFKNPITYSVVNNSEILLSSASSLTKANFINGYEKQLYMLIQLPFGNTSSVCVLEGDYTDLSTERIINLSEERRIPPSVINDTFLSNLSLLRLSDNYDYAFADRLIEFLLWNVICHKDQIDQNIARVQDKLNYTIYTPRSLKGVWSTNLRKTLYEMFLSQQFYEVIDITGFVDKDVEKYLTRQV